MPTKEELKELEKIRKQSNEPKDEEKIVPLTKNLKQFKLAIPKKFADILKIDKEKNKAKFVFHKKENRLTMEII